MLSKFSSSLQNLFSSHDREDQDNTEKEEDEEENVDVDRLLRDLHEEEGESQRPLSIAMEMEEDDSDLDDLDIHQSASSASSFSFSTAQVIPLSELNNPKCGDFATCGFKLKLKVTSEAVSILTANSIHQLRVDLVDSSDVNDIDEKENLANLSTTTSLVLEGKWADVGELVLKNQREIYLFGASRPVGSDYLFISDSPSSNEHQAALEVEIQGTSHEIRKDNLDEMMKKFQSRIKLREKPALQLPNAKRARMRPPAKYKYLDLADLNIRMKKAFVYGLITQSSEIRAPRGGRDHSVLIYITDESLYKDNKPNLSVCIFGSPDELPVIHQHPMIIRIHRLEFRERNGNLTACLPRTHGGAWVTIDPNVDKPLVSIDQLSSSGYSGFDKSQRDRIKALRELGQKWSKEHCMEHLTRIKDFPNGDVSLVCKVLSLTPNTDNPTHMEVVDGTSVSCRLGEQVTSLRPANTYGTILPIFLKGLNQREVEKLKEKVGKVLYIKFLQAINDGVSLRAELTDRSHCVSLFDCHQDAKNLERQIANPEVQGAGNQSKRRLEEKHNYEMVPEDLGRKPQSSSSSSSSSLRRRPSEVFSNSLTVTPRHEHEPFDFIEEVRREKDPSKYKLRVKVVDFEPSDIKDFSRLCCANCKFIVKRVVENPPKYVCAKCKGTETKWRYLFRLIVRDTGCRPMKVIVVYGDAERFLRHPAVDLREDVVSLQRLETQMNLLKKGFLDICIYSYKVNIERRHMEFTEAMKELRSAYPSSPDSMDIEESPEVDKGVPPDVIGAAAAAESSGYMAPVNRGKEEVESTPEPESNEEESSMESQVVREIEEQMVYRLFDTVIDVKADETLLA